MEHVHLQCDKKKNIWTYSYVLCQMITGFFSVTLQLITAVACQ